LALGTLHEIVGGGNGAIGGAATALFAAGIARKTRGKVLWVVRDADGEGCLLNAQIFRATNGLR
jgi:protein ImuA